MFFFRSGDGAYNALHAKDTFLLSLFELGAHF